MPETPDEITDLLRQAQAAEPVVGEFAWVWLETYRRETREILEWHRRQGSLARLMAWAKESGRASG